MRVTLENIQGFRGVFSYTIEKGLNVISSLYNGTGKTTFFECLKFLHNPASMDKISRKFLLNKHEKRGRFMIEIDGNEFGFIIEADNYSLISKLKCEPVFTYSQTPHPLISSYTQVFLSNNMVINICDRFLNLFSSSSTTSNHELVNSFLTHPSLEKSSELIEIEYLHAKKDYEDKTSNAKYYKELLASSNFHPKLEEFKKALDCEDTILFYESLDELLTYLGRCRPTLPLIDINVGLELQTLYELLANVKHVSPIIHKNSLDELLKIDSCLSSVQISSHICQLDSLDEFTLIAKLFAELRQLSDSIEVDYLRDLCHLLNLLHDVKATESIIDSNPISYLAKISSLLRTCRDEYSFIDSSQLQRMINLYTLINSVSLNFEKISISKRKEMQLRADIEEFIYDCPVKGLIYIVEGECLTCVNHT